MTLPAYCILDLVLLASEITLAASRRSRPGEAVGKDRDRGSWRLLWIVTCLAMTAGHLLSLSGVGPELTPVVFWRRLGIGVFVAGLLLRGWAIRHLGQFFTVNVVVASNQRVVDDGPYRYLRHPTYTGLLLEFAGIGLTLGSLTGLLVIIVPVFLVLSRRVRVEEASLAEVLGAPYTDYMRRTKRFVPGLF